MTRPPRTSQYLVVLVFRIIACGASLAYSPGAIADGLPPSITARHCYGTLTNEHGDVITFEIKNSPPYGQQISFLNINTEKSVDITYDDIHHVKRVVQGGTPRYEAASPRSGTFPLDRLFENSEKYTGAKNPRKDFPNQCDYNMQVPTEEFLFPTPSPIEGGVTVPPPTSGTDSTSGQSYLLRIVSNPKQPSGVWRVSRDNPETRKYYIIVEVLDSQGRPAAVDVTSEEDNTTARVSTFGIRVDQRTFEKIRADKQDDGIIQNNRFGEKQAGDLEWRYNFPTLGGAILEWDSKTPLDTQHAPAFVKGRACLFYAPNVKNVAGLIGHAGWAFRDGTGDKWVFGATENTNGTLIIDPGDPKTTQSWQATGTWAQVIKAFSTGIHNNTGSDYYQSYRCINVVASDPITAKGQANYLGRSGYNVIFDNCLTKTVAILQAYGVKALPPACQGSPVCVSPVPPSYYFPVSLRDARFEPAISVTAGSSAKNVGTTIEGMRCRGGVLELLDGSNAGRKISVTWDGTALAERVTFDDNGSVLIINGMSKTALAEFPKTRSFRILAYSELKDNMGRMIPDVHKITSGLLGGDYRAVVRRDSKLCSNERFSGAVFQQTPGYTPLSNLP